MLFDSGAEVSIVDTTFARKVGCVIEESQKQECVGIGENTYMTDGRTRIKITLNGSLVYYFDAWVGDQDTSEWTKTSLPGDHTSDHNSDQYVLIPVGKSTEVKIGVSSPKAKIWVRRDPKWVPTVTTGPGQIKYLQLTNIGDQEVDCSHGPPLGWWMAADMIPRSPGYVSVESRRYNEWQTVAFEATTDREEEPPEEFTGPLVDHPSYPTPKKILTRSKEEAEKRTTETVKLTTRPNEECDAIREIGGNNVEDRVIEGKSEQLAQSSRVINAIRGMSNVDHAQGPWGEENYTHNNYTQECMERDPTTDDRDLADLVVNDRDQADLVSNDLDLDDPVVNDRDLDDPVVNDRDLADPVVNDRDLENPVVDDRDLADPVVNDRDLDDLVINDRDPADPDSDLREQEQASDTTTINDECNLAGGSVKMKPEDSMYYHESGELYAEDVDQHMAVLPEIVSSTEEVTIDYIQVGDPGVPLTKDQEGLRQLIWANRHLLIGKGNALPPAARGAVCDIDVGGAHPIAQRVRPVAPKFREKLADLIKGLLSARIIQPSTSPWASPIVRIYARYKDKAMWYCSLDMASGFWVVEMTERARMISAFITQSGLFEWLRMPFGLKNAPQIYQRLIDNALYGYLKIGTDPNAIVTGSLDSTDTVTGSPKLVDVITEGEPDTSQKPSVLGRRSYIDDILISATSWASLYDKVKRLIEVCNEWNLSISLAKSCWGRRKVDYLGHQVSLAGIEAHPKDLGSLVNIPFPKTLRSMQSFLESLNYYSRFVEDFEIYASVLYELREADFHEICCSDKMNALNSNISTRNVRIKFPTLGTTQIQKDGLDGKKR
ncbi:unnamed protein product [Peronospora effusa]|nr:unnamed protein product [Peronospora effusa]